MSKNNKEKSVQNSDIIDAKNAFIGDKNDLNEIPLDLNSLMNNIDLNSLTGMNIPNNRDNSFDLNSLMSNIDMNTLINNIDMGSLVNVATNLLNDDSLKNSAKELTNSTQVPILNLLNGSDKKDSGVLTSVAEKLEKLTNEFSELKKELIKLNEQNQNLTILIKKLLEKSDSKKKSK